MPVRVEQDESRYVIRWEGEVGVTDAEDLRRLLLEGLAAGHKLHLDLGSIKEVSELDVTSMQLLHAASQEAGRSGTGVSLRLSDAAELALRGAGFRAFPGATGWSN